MTEQTGIPFHGDDNGIRWTIAAYCHLLDDKRFKECADLFTQDGEFLRPDGVTTTGRKALFELFSGPSGPPPGPTRHVMLNHRIEHSGPAEATCTSDFQYWSFVGPAQMVTAGRYRDTLVSIAGRWLFRRRVVAEIIFNDLELRARLQS